MLTRLIGLLLALLGQAPAAGFQIRADVQMTFPVGTEAELHAAMAKLDAAPPGTSAVVNVRGRIRLTRPIVQSATARTLTISGTGSAVLDYSGLKWSPAMGDVNGTELHADVFRLQRITIANFRAAGRPSAALKLYCSREISLDRVKFSHIGTTAYPPRRSPPASADDHWGTCVVEYHGHTARVRVTDCVFTDCVVDQFGWWDRCLYMEVGAAEIRDCLFRRTGAPIGVSAVGPVAGQRDGVVLISGCRFVEPVRARRPIDKPPFEQLERPILFTVRGPTFVTGCKASGRWGSLAGLRVVRDRRGIVFTDNDWSELRVDDLARIAADSGDETRPGEYVSIARWVGELQQDVGSEFPPRSP